MARTLLATALALALALLAWMLMRGGSAPAEVVPAPASPESDGGEPRPVPAAEEGTAEREAVEAVEAADEADEHTSDTPTPPEAVLAVRVVAREDGAPLPGVELHVRPRPTRSPRPVSGEDGRVEIHVPAGQQLEVTVFPAFDFHGAASLTQPALATADRAEVVLALPTRPDALFHARLVDAESGEPVRQALIHSPMGASSARVHEGHERGPGVTPVDGEGRFLLRYGTWDHVQLCVHAPGWSLALVHPSTGHDTPEREQLVPLVRAARLSVDVLDASGRPQADVAVEVTASGMDLLLVEGAMPRFGTPDPRWKTVTAGDGHAVLAGLPARTGLHLTVRRGREELHSRQVADLEPAEERTLELRLGTGATVSGEAVEAGGAALEDVEIWLLEGAREVYLSGRIGDPKARTRTDAVGRFRFEQVPAGGWSVGLAPQDPGVPPEQLLSTTTTPVEVGADDVSVRLVAHRGLVLEGRVVDASGRGVEGLGVSARSQRPWGRLGTRSGPEGGFLIGGLAPGELELSASGPGSQGPFAPSDSVTAQAGQRGIVLRVEAAASLAGQLVAPPGAQLGSVDLLVVRSDGPVPVTDLTTRRLQGSSFDVRGLSAGIWGLGVTTSDGLVGVLGGIALEAGERREDLVLRLEPGAELRVRDGLGPERSGSTISVHVDGACVGWNGTVPGGTVAFRVPGGRLRVVAMRSGAVVGELEVDVLAGEVTEIVLE